jgi:hypothetical protein
MLAAAWAVAREAEAALGAPPRHCATPAAAGSRGGGHAGSGARGLAAAAAAAAGSGLRRPGGGGGGGGGGLGHQYQSLAELLGAQCGALRLRSCWPRTGVCTAEWQWVHGEGEGPAEQAAHAYLESEAWDAESGTAPPPDDEEQQQAAALSGSGICPLDIGRRRCRRRRRRRCGCGCLRAGRCGGAGCARESPGSSASPSPSSRRRRRRPRDDGYAIVAHDDDDDDDDDDGGGGRSIYDLSASSPSGKARFGWLRRQSA